jgi:hypothetical protein
VSHFFLHAVISHSIDNGTRLEEHLLHPLENPGAPGGPNPDHIINIDFSRDKTDADRLVWTVNDVAYQSPDLPTRKSSTESLA